VKSTIKVFHLILHIFIYLADKEVVKPFFMKIGIAPQTSAPFFFYDAKYRLFVDVDSVNFEIRKNFLLLNNSKNGTSAVLYRKE
jgi:hypothetical protein